MELCVNNISKYYNSKKVLDDVSFQFYSGNNYLILGKNGAGKSTLVNIIGDEIKADEGSVILQCDEKKLDPQKELVIQFQDYNSFPFLKVKEAIKLFNEITIDPKPSTELYDILQLHRIENSLINKLSGGEKKSLSLYLTLLLNKKVVILDEPFADLDLDKKEQLKDYLLGYSKETNKILIFISHEVKAYQELFDEIMFLDGGKIIESGTQNYLTEKYIDSRIPGVEGIFFEITGKMLEVK